MLSFPYLKTITLCAENSYGMHVSLSEGQTVTVTCTTEWEQTMFGFENSSLEFDLKLEGSPTSSRSKRVCVRNLISSANYGPCPKKVKEDKVKVAIEVIAHLNSQRKTEINGSMTRLENTDNGI